VCIEHSAVFGQTQRLAWLFGTGREAEEIQLGNAAAVLFGESAKGRRLVVINLQPGRFGERFGVDHQLCGTEG
jgi:hypothetical protein